MCVRVRSCVPACVCVDLCACANWSFKALIAFFLLQYDRRWVLTCFWLFNRFVGFISSFLWGLYCDYSFFFFVNELKRRPLVMYPQPACPRTGPPSWATTRTFTTRALGTKSSLALRRRKLFLSFKSPQPLLLLPLSSSSLCRYAA